MKSADRPVARDRDVPDDGDPEQCPDVRVVGLRLERVPEEDEEVDVARGDHRAELLVAAERPALQLDDPDPELVLEQRAGRPRRDQVVRHQHLRG